MDTADLHCGIGVLCSGQAWLDSQRPSKAWGVEGGVRGTHCRVKGAKLQMLAIRRTQSPSISHGATVQASNSFLPCSRSPAVSAAWAQLWMTPLCSDVNSLGILW